MFIAVGMGKDGLRPGPDAWRWKRSEVGERKRAPPSQQTLGSVRRTAGEKAVRSPAQVMVNDPGVALGKGLRSGYPNSGFSRQTAGVRKRPGRRQRINRRCEGVKRSGSAAPRVKMRGRSSWPGFLFLSATSWAMVVMVIPTMHRIEPVAGGAMLDPGSASRSGRALIP